MIALTGATGFLGRRVAQRLVDDGVDVRCLVRASSDTEPLKQHVGDAGWRRVDIVRAELLDEAGCRDALAGCEVLLHVAAGMTGSTSTLFLNSVSSTKALLKAAADAGVRRVVLISSLGIYDGSAAKRRVLTEETPLDPDPPARDPYTYAKLVQEREARKLCTEHGLELVVLRPGVITGPGRDVVSGRCGVKVGPLLVQMGGRQQMPYTFVENCADAIVQAVTADVAGETFNILDDDLPTASQLIRTVRKSGRRIRRVWVPGPIVPTLCGLYHWYTRLCHNQLPPVLTRYRAKAMWGRVKYSNAKAKERLGWSPAVSTKDAIERCLHGGAA